jgi:hypothetical protein
MQKQILEELQTLRLLFSKLIGTSHQLGESQFSVEALDKAAKEFQKLSIQRGEWVDDYGIQKYIKTAPYSGTGKFIRTTFGFSNYMQKGRAYYYNKQSLIDLGKELKLRDINLERYMEYLSSKAEFQKNLANIASKKKQAKSKKSYHIPNGLRDIATSPPKMPSSDFIKEDLSNLKKEFFEHSLSEYIDIYESGYAMLKHIYPFSKYLDPKLLSRCRKWCNNYNYANHALQEVAAEKDTFIPVKEEDMIQL